MHGKLLAGALGALALSGCATTYSITPVDTGLAQVSWQGGRPTTDLELHNGAVMVTPLGVEVNGRISFAVAGYNKLGTPAYFGPENFTAHAGGTPVPVYTYAQLEREAQNAATWAAFAVALTGVATAYAASNDAYRTVDTTVYTPRGVHVSRATVYDPAAAALGTAAAAALTVGGLQWVDEHLDATLQRLGGTLLQTTTVAPAQTHGGQIVVGRSRRAVPYEVEVVAHWNGEDYVFRYRVDTGR